MKFKIELLKILVLLLIIIFLYHLSRYVNNENLMNINKKKNYEYLKPHSYDTKSTFTIRFRKKRALLAIGTLLGVIGSAFSSISMMAMGEDASKRSLYRLE